jgi:hypothetical protein
LRTGIVELETRVLIRDASPKSAKACWSLVEEMESAPKSIAVQGLGGESS